MKVEIQTCARPIVFCSRPDLYKLEMASKRKQDILKH